MPNGLAVLLSALLGVLLFAAIMLLNADLERRGKYGPYPYEICAADGVLIAHIWTDENPVPSGDRSWFVVNGRRVACLYSNLPYTFRPAEGRTAAALEQRRGYERANG